MTHDRLRWHIILIISFKFYFKDHISEILCAKTFNHEHYFRTLSQSNLWWLNSSNSYAVLSMAEESFEGRLISYYHVESCNSQTKIIKSKTNRMIERQDTEIHQKVTHTHLNEDMKFNHFIANPFTEAILVFILASHSLDMVSRGC